MTTTTAMADEWTVVPRRSSTKNHHHHNNRKRSSRRSNIQRCTGDIGLYSAVASGSGASNPAGDDSTRRCDELSQSLTEEKQREEKEQTKADILECMVALKNHLHSGNNLADSFVELMNVATASSSSSPSSAEYPEPERAHNTVQENSRSQANDPNCLHLREIVAYGIGNFAIERFRAPMLQLALLLLVRKWAAAYSTKQSTQADHANQPLFTDNSNGAESYLDMSEESFQNDQRQVPIYYYDPCILSVEKELLDKTFHVHVLESNEMGKLSLESMRLQYHQQQSADNASPSLSPHLSSTTNQRESKHSLPTLYFMPHCPMQLYCNVLWANWYYIFPHSTESQEICDTDHGFNTTSSNNTDQSIQSNSGDKSSIIIFGNSFQTYDERTISSESRSNPTNGVIRIAPYTKEIPISFSSNTDRKCGGGGGELIVDALRHLGTAFNDCNIIYFGRNIVAADSTLPERPEEWIASQDSGRDGELR